MRFTINLATRTYLDYRWINRGCVAGVVTLLVLLTWNVTRFSSNLGELRRVGADSTALESRLGSRPPGVSEKEYGRMQASIRFFNEVIDRKAYSWPGLLEQLENTLPEGIALVAVGPLLKTGELKIEGRTKSFALVKAYLEKMEESRYFTNILLLSHHDIALGERGRGVQFVISCRVVKQ